MYVVDEVMGESRERNDNTVKEGRGGYNKESCAARQCGGFFLGGCA